MGIRPGRLSTTPPKDSSDRWWSVSGSNESEALIKLIVPVGSIIDVDLTVRLPENEAPVAGESGTALGATVGQVYWNYLDGFASKLLTPVGGVSVLP